MIRAPLPTEALLRPIGEFWVLFACFSAGLMIHFSYEYLFMNKYVANTSILFLALISLLYAKDAWYLMRYQRNIKELKAYTVESKDIIYEKDYLNLGMGFRWTAKHTQRLADTKLSKNAKYIEPSERVKKVRNFCLKNKKHPKIKYLVKCIQVDIFLNPFKKLPPIGGIPALHGVEPEEMEVLWEFSQRVGHTGIFGTTRTGKTRWAEYIIAQDIRAGSKKLRGKDGNIGNVVVVIDPKGDGELLRRVITECINADRLDEFRMIHLGFPNLSEAYNPIGDYQKVTEVATRSTSQLSDSGNSSAFKDFSWRFVNIAAQAIEKVGESVSYDSIQHYLEYGHELLEKYIRTMMKLNDDEDAWFCIVEGYIEGLDERAVKKSTKTPKVLATLEYGKALLKDDECKLFQDSILAGLISATDYEKSYYDKLISSLHPFLDKMTTGDLKEIFSPKPGSKKKRFRWRDVIAQRGVVYIGLDALTDPVVAGAFANSCLADLVSLTGEIYKKGSITDEVNFLGNQNIPIFAHLDEFNEIVSGDEIIQFLNKAGGAGVIAHLYTQTLRDIEAKLGDTAKASQIVGNLQNIIMMRVRGVETAELLTEQLPTVEISTVTDVGGTSDQGKLDEFRTDNSDRRTTKEVPMITTSDIIGLSVGQGFLFNNGGHLHKIRAPMITNEPIKLDDKVERLIAQMKEKYSTGDSASSSTWGIRHG